MLWLIRGGPTVSPSGALVTSVTPATSRFCRNLAVALVMSQQWLLVTLIRFSLIGIAVRAGRGMKNLRPDCIVSVHWLARYTD